MLSHTTDLQIKIQTVKMKNYVKLRMVTHKFSGYALVWWNQYIREVKDGRRRHIDIWLDLKREMKGSKSVEEYYKDMKVVLIRANVLESNEAIMARFLHSMKREIQDVVESYHYTSLDDLVHQAT
ncbi:hypothetical protein CR513_13647, partial [Mucuna pruriens]